MNKSEFNKLILFAIILMMMFIVMPLQTKALQQQGFTLEVENAKLCNRLFCIGGEVEYNPNLEAYIVRDQSRTYYAGVSVKVGGCGNTASDTALVLTFDQITSSYGLRTKLDGLADDKSTAVHGSFTNILFKANQCDNRPPYEYKWPNSNEDRGLILDIYENDDRAACACSDPAVCGGASMSCNDNGYPYKCPFPLQRRDPPHYSTDLGRFSGIRQLSSVEKFETEETKTYTFYVPFNFNVVQGGMSENVHTIKTFAWARMDHWSVPEHVYMWDWNDPDGRIKVHPGCTSTQILNTATGKCECPADEIFDSTTRKCDCKVGFIRDPDSGICEPERCVCKSGDPPKCDVNTYFECDGCNWVDKGRVECCPGDTRPCEGGTQTCI